MSKERFKQMQDTYAQAMSKFGLVHGKEGSETRHISTQHYYGDLCEKNDDLKKDIEYLEERKQEVNEKIRDLYDHKDKARDKFFSMNEYNKQKENEISETESRLEKLKQQYEPYKAQDELNLIHNLFPMMKELLRTADLCTKIGLAVDSIKALLAGRHLTAKTFSFFPPEHKQKFTAEDVKLKMEKESDNPDKLRLNLNGMNILDWFREQYQRMKQATCHYTRPNIKPEVGKNKGIKM